MEEIPSHLWVAACAHKLQQRWRTVDPEELAQVALNLRKDEKLRAMQPAEAASTWLKPVTIQHDSNVSDLSS